MLVRSIKSKLQRKFGKVKTIEFDKTFSYSHTLHSSTQANLSRNKDSILSSFTKKGFRQSISPFILLLTAALLLASCEKEYVSDPVSDSISTDKTSSLSALNSLPDVEAGPVERVIYPAASGTRLSGSGPKNAGTLTYSWKQVKGNSNATIESPNQSSTKISNLKPGIYTFTLTVTDSKGNSGTDTTYVTVLEKITWTVAGLQREALVHPAQNGANNAPVLFAFHGHSGTDKGFAGKGFELEWPDAVVVYPQGLPTTSNGDKSAQRSGWQHSVGEVNTRTGVKDQDLQFFDAMLDKFQSAYHANTNQVFVHGWSNGGEFVYDVLWAARADKLAGLAPAAAAVNTTSGKKTLPVIHAAGEHDPNVKFSRQQQSAESVRKLDKCSQNGTVWATGSNGLLGTRYSSSINDPVVFLQYNGGHGYPSSVPAQIVRFFREVSGL